MTCGSFHALHFMTLLPQIQLPIAMLPLLCCYKLHPHTSMLPLSSDYVVPPNQGRIVVLRYQLLEHASDFSRYFYDSMWDELSRFLQCYKC